MPSTQRTKMEKRRKKISRKNKKQKQNERTMRVIEKEGTITSININGLKQQKLAILENYILEQNPEVMLIQETHIRAEELTYDMKIEGYSHGVTEREEGQKKGGGSTNVLEREHPSRNVETRGQTY